MISWGWTFTNLLTAAGVFVGLANPIFGLMCYHTLSVLRPAYLWFWVWPGGSPRYSMYVALSVLIGWAVKGFGAKGSMRYVRLPIFGLGVYLLAGTFSWQLNSFNSDVAWDALRLQYKIGLMSLVTLSLIRTPQQIKVFAWVMLAALGYLAWEFNVQFIFQGWNRILLRGFGGIDNNGIAMIMVMAAPLAFFMGLTTSKWWARLACFFITACLVHVVLFSFSRGGQLGLCVVGVCLFVIAMTKLPHKGRTLLLTVAFVFISLQLAGPEVRERFTSIFISGEDRDRSASSRFETWSGAWECMKDYPLGVGPRNFNLVSHRYGLPPNKSVHNLYLQTGADYGFLGMLGLFTFYAGTILRCFNMANTHKAGEMVWPRYFGHMVALSLTGMMVCSVFIGMESVETGFQIALIGLCTCTHVYSLIEQEKKSSLEDLERYSNYPDHLYAPPIMQR